MAEKEPVERRVVRGKLRLQVVDDLLNNKRQFQGGEVAIPGRSARLHLRFQFAQKLAYLLKTLVHLAQNFTPKNRPAAAEFDAQPSTTARAKPSRPLTPAA